MSNVYEIEVPQLVLTSSVDLSLLDGKGGVVLDWSGYDISDKYFVIYRKEENSSDWECIVSLEEKYCNNKFIDNLGNDKNVPSITSIDIEGDRKNSDIGLTVNATDSGTKYYYYIEAYDSRNEEKLVVSDIISDKY